MNVCGHDHKVGSKHIHIVNATVDYSKSETGHVVILLINQVIKMKSLDHHLLCPIQYCMNGVMIDEVPKVLAMYTIQLENPFDTTHSIIISLK